MRAVVQRVREAAVRVDGRLLGEIGPGLLVLLGVGRADTPQDSDWLAVKIAQLRIFPDDGGRMNRSLLEAGGAALVVSQFTLYGDCRQGRRPAWAEAAPPELAQPLYERFCESLRGAGVSVARGAFGADMDVALVNHGPVTLLLDSSKLF